MFNLGAITNVHKQEYKKWLYIPDHPYRTLIIGGSGSGKTIALLNLIKEQEVVVLSDMTADIMTNKTFQAIIKQLFIRCRKLNIFPSFITQSYFSVPKEVRLNSKNYVIMKIYNIKRATTNCY